MKKRFVCLANSNKEGGRCVAGIEVDARGNIVMEEGAPKWIRPVSNHGHGEILTHLVSDIDLLDVIEIEVTEECPQGYQSENVFFDECSLESKTTIRKSKLIGACEDWKYIFGTRYPSVKEEVIEELTHSLMLIKVDDFEVIEAPNEHRQGHTQVKLKFLYGEFEYLLPITDPKFLNNYQKNNNLLDDTDEIMLCLSLGVKFEKTGRYYKLVAGVIY